MTTTLPKSAPRFTYSVNNTKTGNCHGRNASRSERSIAADNMRDAVAEEARLLRAKDTSGQLERVRARIDAYCADFPGLDNLVYNLRDRYGILNAPATTPAA